MKFYKSNLIQYIIIVVQNKTIVPEFRWKYQITSNTVLYAPFAENVKDQISGNNMSGGTYTFGKSATSDKVNSLHLTSGNMSLSGSSALPTGNNARTLSLRIKSTSYVNDEVGVLGYGTSSSNRLFFLVQRVAGLGFTQHGSGFTSSSKLTNNQWTNLILSHNGSTTYLYMNGQLIASGGYSLNTQGTTVYVAHAPYSTNDYLYGYFSEIIGENVFRDSTKALTYYNNSKRNYGIA